MKFDELDKEMRVYETSIDQRIIPESIIAARLDGRSFTHLTRDVCNFEAPFDVIFRDYMAATVKHLMDCGFQVIYGYTESDEISLLFSQSEDAFSRKVRKYNSILAGEASAAFSLQLGRTASFDCRMIPLPNLERLRDYFLWRQEDAARNALNAHCYWLLRKEGASPQEAAARLSGASVSARNELLFSRGINFNDLPLWQKRGTGVYWRAQQKDGFDPVAQQITSAERMTLCVDYELPVKKQYADFICDLFAKKAQPK